MHTTPSTPRFRRLRNAALGCALLFVACAVVVAGCTGMKKLEIEQRLLELPKNAAVRELGLERRVAKVALEGRMVDVEYTWLHVPASDEKRRTRAPIVFVHGTPCSLFNWSLVLFDGKTPSELVGAADIYALDVIGHGVGRTTAAPYSFQSCADSVRGFLAMLDLRDVTLVGQSYGGEFAWRAALDAPDRVAKLVLMDSSGYRRGDDEWFPEEHKLREWPGAQFGYWFNSKERLRPVLQLHFGKPLREDQLDEMFLLCENADNWKAMTQLCRDENGTRESEIAKISQPTLLLWGANDLAYTVEKCAKRFARDIPKSKLVTVPGAGHYPHEENVEFVRRALLDFHLAR